tara:strand:+ start:60457 stop:61470 length:1014 start_codon:yes stop_codon:yes gene_type:complete
MLIKKSSVAQFRNKAFMTYSYSYIKYGYLFLIRKIVETKIKEISKMDNFPKLLTALLFSMAYALLALFLFNTTDLLSCNKRSFKLSEEDTVLEYTPEQQTVRGQTLILPPTGGANFIDKKLARGLCRRGHKVFVLNYNQPNSVVKDLGIHDKLSRKVFESVNSFLETHPHPTAIYGSSLGGIYGSAIFSYGMNRSEEYPTFSKVEAFIGTVTGGPLHEVLTHSTTSDVKKQRKLRFKTGTYKNIQAYQESLKAAIDIDPLEYASPSDDVLLFISTQDTGVPARTQFNLARAYQAETEKIRWFGHAFAITLVGLTKAGRISEFIKSSFDVGEEHKDKE